MKLEFNWPSGFRGKIFENVDGRTHGRGSHWYKLKSHLQLEDLKPSPDLLNNIKISQGQLRLIFLNIICFTIYGHGGHFGQMT